VQLLTNQTKKAFCVPKKRKSKVLFSGLTRQVRSGGKIQGAIMVQGARFLKEHPKLIMQIVSQIPICLTNQLQPASQEMCMAERAWSPQRGEQHQPSWPQSPQGPQYIGQAAAEVNAQQNARILSQTVLGQQRKALPQEYHTLPKAPRVVDGLVVAQGSGASQASPICGDQLHHE
jgi:hypothetical protein